MLEKKEKQHSRPLYPIFSRVRERKKGLFSNDVYLLLTIFSHEDVHSVFSVIHEWYTQ